MNRVSKIILLLSFVLGSQLLANEVCTIKHRKKCEENIPFNNATFRVKLDSWEDCFNKAVEKAKESNLINKHSFQNRAFRTITTATCINYFSWEYNDGFIDDSDGMVTRYTPDHMAGPRLGDQRVYQNGYLLDPEKPLELYLEFMKRIL